MVNSTFCVWPFGVVTEATYAVEFANPDTDAVVDWYSFGVAGLNEIANAIGYQFEPEALFLPMELADSTPYRDA